MILINIFWGQNNFHWMEKCVHNFTPILCRSTPDWFKMYRISYCCIFFCQKISTLLTVYLKIFLSICFRILYVNDADITNIQFILISKLNLTWYQYFQMCLLKNINLCIPFTTLAEISFGVNVQQQRLSR